MTSKPRRCNLCNSEVFWGLSEVFSIFPIFFPYGSSRSFGSGTGLWWLGQLYLLRQCLDRVPMFWAFTSPHPPKIFPPRATSWSPFWLPSSLALPKRWGYVGITRCWIPMCSPFRKYLELSIVMGDPQNGWLIRENPLINGWLRGTLISGNLHISQKCKAGVQLPQTGINYCSL